jgi:predicted phage terminase large subunit-like protein
MLSRVEGQAKIIVNMTRWTDADICGRILEDELLASETCVIKYEAMDLKSGKLLCEDIMNLRKYNLQKKSMDPAIFMANYHQRPINNEGRLFKILKQYKQSDINANFSSVNSDIRAVIDPTDGKNDFLCCIAYLVDKGQVYITSVLHTQKAEEQTPQRVARWLIENGVKKYRVETNKNRQFALDLPLVLKEKYNSTDKQMVEIYNTENKAARIQTAAWWVQNNVFFPEKWNVLYKEFYDHIYGYQSGGKNRFDDAPDALTEIKADVYNNVTETRQVFGFAIPYKRQMSAEEKYCYGN